MRSVGLCCKLKSTKYTLVNPAAIGHRFQAKVIQGIAFPIRTKGGSFVELPIAVFVVSSGGREFSICPHHVESLCYANTVSFDVYFSFFYWRICQRLPLTIRIRPHDDRPGAVQINNVADAFGVAFLYELQHVGRIRIASSSSNAQNYRWRNRQ